MKKSFFILLLAFCTFIFSGCHGNSFSIYQGTTEQQDSALLEDLTTNYPDMEFTCIGHPESNIHTVLATDGTEFPVWIVRTGNSPYQITPPYQITDYYLEEWLFAKGYFSSLEENLAERGFSWRYKRVNNYDKHFHPIFGELTNPVVLADGVDFLYDAHEQYEELMEEFIAQTGAPEIPTYIMFVDFLINGKESWEYCYIGPNGGWNKDFNYDEYEHYFDYELYHIPDHAIEQNDAYYALAKWYGQNFDAEHFDDGLHRVCERVNAITGTDITDLEWTVTFIDENELHVSCYKYELRLIHGEQTDDGYFWIHSLSDTDGNLLHTWG